MKRRDWKSWFYALGTAWMTYRLSHAQLNVDKLYDGLVLAASLRWLVLHHAQDRARVSVDSSLRKNGGS